MTGALAALTTAIFKTGTSAGVVPRGHRLTTENHIHEVGSGLLSSSCGSLCLAA